MAQFSALDMDAFKKFALLLAAESQQLILKHLSKPIDVYKKEDASPVTAADRETEQMIRDRIMSAYPSHGIFGEEFGKYQEGAACTWVLDPIDGTKSFICGSPLFGTLIALLHEGRPILGVINLPVLNQCLIGDGKEALLNGKRVHVRRREGLGDAVLLTTDIVRYGEYADAAAFRRLGERVALCRTWGDCYGYALLASGGADIMIDPIMSTWDIMALVPVVQGAGGVITDFSGGDPANGNSIIAASPELHPLVLEALRPSRGSASQ